MNKIVQNLYFMAMITVSSSAVFASGIIKEEYLVIILGYFSYFSIKTCIVVFNRSTSHTQHNLFLWITGKKNKLSPNAPS